jgi:hypothetical protein
MAFVASLIAYLGAVGGIVAAFLIALAALLATPDQGPNPTRAAVTAHQPTRARAATAAGPKATPLNTAKRQIAKSQIAKDQPAKSQQLANVQSRTGQGVAQDERGQHAPSSGARPQAGQWAYQQESDTGHWDPGEAEQPDNPFDRIW